MTLTVISALAFSAHAQKGSRYDSLRKLSSRQLVERGEKLLQRPDATDSILACFSIASAGYSAGITEGRTDDVRPCRPRQMGCILFRLFDYPKAYEALQRTLEICERNGFDKSKVETSIGGILQMMAEQSGNTGFTGKPTSTMRQDSDIPSTTAIRTLQTRLSSTFSR